jgi:hypothetical protein
MAATSFSCFPLAMADQLFFHHLRSAENKPLWPKLDQIAPARFCRISLKPVYRRGHDFQLVLGSRCKRIFTSGLERRAI